MRKLALLSAILSLCGCAQTSQNTTTTQSNINFVYMQKDAAKNVIISELADNNIHFLSFAIGKMANLEGVFCMIGSVDNAADTVRVDLFVPAWIDSASGGNASYKPNGCTMPNVIGTMHLHPGIGFCKLSGDDIVSAHSLPWPVTSFVCTESEGARPKLIVVHKKIFDEEWRILVSTEDLDTGPNGFTPVYRYIPPDKRP